MWVLFWSLMWVLQMWNTAIFFMVNTKGDLVCTIVFFLWLRFSIKYLVQGKLFELKSENGFKRNVTILPFSAPSPPGLHIKKEARGGKHKRQTSK